MSEVLFVSRESGFVCDTSRFVFLQNVLKKGHYLFIKFDLGRREEGGVGGGKGEGGRGEEEGGRRREKEGRGRRKEGEGGVKRRRGGGGVKRGRRGEEGGVKRRRREKGEKEECLFITTTQIGHYLYKGINYT